MSSLQRGAAFNGEVLRRLRRDLTAARPPKSRTPSHEPAPSFTPPGNPVQPAYSPSHAGSGTPQVAKRYKALRLIAMLYKILALVVGGVCVLMGCSCFVSGIAIDFGSSTAIGLDLMGIFGGTVGGLFLLVYGAFLFIFLYGLGEWMYVFMDIEENTRKTNETLALRPPAH